MNRTLKDRLFIVAGLLLIGSLFMLWIGMARPDSERISGSGFDARGPAFVGAPPAPRGEPGRASSVAFVRRGAEDPALAQPAAASLAAPAEESGPPQRATIASAVEAEDDDGIKEAGADEAAAQGIPTDKEGLFNAGMTKGLMTKLAGKLIDHPRVLKFLLNNKTFNDGVFNAKWTKKLCEDPSTFRSYLSRGSGDGEKSRLDAQIPVYIKLSMKPEVAAMAANSEFAKRGLACPGVQATARDSQAILAIAKSTPQLALVMPVVAQNPAGQELVDNVKAVLDKNGSGVRVP